MSEELLEQFGSFELWRTSEEARRQTGMRLFLKRGGQRFDEWSIYLTVDTDGTPMVRINPGEPSSVSE